MYLFQDFGDIIPGHGGIMDRFDCQFLMATFVNVYIHSFIRTASPQKLMQQVSDNFYLRKEEYSDIEGLRSSLDKGRIAQMFSEMQIMMNEYLFKVFVLKPEEQLTLYYSLRDSLRERGILLH